MISTSVSIAWNEPTLTKTAHTQITAQGCELTMSVSSARLTAIQTNAGNLSSQNQEEGLCGVNTVAAWRRSQARQ